MENKFTELERAVVEAAMVWLNDREQGITLISHCRALEEARASLNPVPGEAAAWAAWSKNMLSDFSPTNNNYKGFFNTWEYILKNNPRMVTAFRDVLLIAIKADRAIRNV